MLVVVFKIKNFKPWLVHWTFSPRREGTWQKLTDNNRQNKTIVSD
jgi:hypothetical protein